jgi:hypothetical protein
MMDTIDRHFTSSPELTFIEPFPDRLMSLMQTKDRSRCRVIVDRVQNVDLSIFTSLNEGDMLFIDSSHISKVGSDVNYLIFKILPRLKSGVIIHFHDICYPFEYPREWIYDGIYWNEAYLLRAFLMNNNDYTILLFNNYMWQCHRDWLGTLMPSFTSGGSLYLQKR